MKDYIKERTVTLAEYIVDHKTTVRDTAKTFNISKSTVHKDITERLPSVNSKLAKEAKRVLEENKAARHIRGGLATKKKYNMQKNGEHN